MRVWRKQPFILRSWLSISVLIVVWTYVAFRSYPKTNSDRGIFVSVAERLLSGDRLYVDVYDNKEPIFYYFVALQRLFGFGGEWVSEISLIILSCFLCHRIFIYFKVPGSAQISTIAVPLILVGAFYVPGYTHLPGIFLSLLAIYFALQGWAASAGLAIAFVFMTKITFGPLALAACVAAFTAHTSFKTQFLKAFFGGAGGLILIVLVLIIRDEHLGFFQVFLDNIAYSQSAVRSDEVERFTERLFPSNRAQFVTLVMVCIGVVAASGWSLRNTFKGLRIIVTVSATFAVSIILTTAIWDHHWQTLYLPIILLSGFLPNVMEQARSYHRYVGLAALGVLMGGGLPIYIQNVDQLLTSPPSLEMQVLLENSKNRPTVYARLGSNDENGHARGLGSWSLLCPRFHIYQFQSLDVLYETTNCALEAPILLIGRSFSMENWNWNSELRQFFTSVEQRIEKDFECTGRDGVRVCTHRINATAESLKMN